MSYEFIKLSDEDKLTTQKLAQFLHNETDARVVFMDIVSVEKKANTNYKVKWFGDSRVILIYYYNLITSYFKYEQDFKLEHITRQPKSLLFLKPERKQDTINGINTKHEFFPDTIALEDEFKQLNFDECLITEFSFNDTSSIATIAEEDECIQKNNWNSEILSKLSFPSVTFSKIEFTINDRDFIAAIWIGYNKRIKDEFTIPNSKLTPHIENFLWSYSSNSIATELMIETIQQATRAAISQVMARNTSHNMGAHVMNKLIGDLSALPLFNYTDITQYNYQSTSEIDFKKLHKEVEIKINDDSDLSSLTDTQKVKVLKHRILLEQISLFNNYVKCRMDYLADISFGTPLMQTNKYAYSELFTELDKVRLLLEHISGLSDFKYKIEFKRNGEPLTTDNDLLVAIPNDILGTQAFYNILENIIRNTAKHSSIKPDITVFTVNFIDEIGIEVNGKKEKVVDYCECEENACKCTKPTKKEIENTLNEFIAVEVYDNIPIKKPDEALDLILDDIKEFNDKKTALPTDNKFRSYIDKLVFRQNKNLNEDILNNNKLRSSSLGLVEMDASAAYLRKRPVEYINHQSYNIQYDESWSRDTEINNNNQEIRGTNCRHFLKAFKTNEEFEISQNNKEPIKGHALGYRFFLHRPAVVLVITEELKDDTDKKDKLKKEGIWVITKEIFTKELKAGKVYPHEFVVYTDDSVKATIDDYKTYLPIRILNVKYDDLKCTDGKCLFDATKDKDENGKTVLDKWEEFCWEKWFEKEFYCNEQKKAKVCKEHTTDHRVPFAISNGVSGRACYHITLLDHLYSDNNTKTAVEQWCEKVKANPEHLEALSSLAQSKMPDFNKLTKDSIKGVSDRFKEVYLGKVNNKEIIAFKKIIEAALAKVIVIDERIQEAAKEPEKGGRDFMKIPYKDLYAKMGIIVPDKETEIDLSENTYSKELITKIKAYLGLKFEENEQNNGNIQCVLNDIKSTDFILIHYSIFERMFGKDEINKRIEEIAAKGINVVITSGRGIPYNLTPKARFVNLSSVITTFIDIRSKYAVNYLLNSSRKSNKI